MQQQGSGLWFIIGLAGAVVLFAVLLAVGRKSRKGASSPAKAPAGLLLDEADPLFGKRTEVKDSHDRYANSNDDDTKP